MGKSSQAVSIGNHWARHLGTTALQYPSMPYHPTTLQLREQEIQACDVSSQKMGTPNPLVSVSRRPQQINYMEKIGKIEFSKCLNEASPGSLGVTFGNHPSWLILVAGLTLCFFFYGAFRKSAKPQLLYQTPGVSPLLAGRLQDAVDTHRVMLQPLTFQVAKDLNCQRPSPGLPTENSPKRWKTLEN